jgi:cyclic pyranopterin phosphate synthase
VAPDDALLVFNVNEPRDYSSPEAFRAVLRFVVEAVRRGFDVALGFNVWRVDMDPAFMPALAADLGRPGFRWAVANPVCGVPNSTLRPDEFAELAKACMTLLREATARGLVCALDCHLPTCFFSDVDWGWIAQHQPGIIARIGRCQPPIDVTPEMEAFGCFATSPLARVRVTDFKSESELQRYFADLDLGLIDSPGVYGGCNTCRHFIEARCQGGCHGWRDKQPCPTPQPLAEQLMVLLRDGQSQRALSEFRQANKWHHSALVLYLAAVAAEQVGDMECAWRYATSCAAQATAPTLRFAVLGMLTNLRPPPSLGLLPLSSGKSFVSAANVGK